MILRKHIPSMCDGVKEEQWQVESTDELLELDWVKSWHKDFDGLPFSQFSQSKDGDEYLLMAEWRKGAVRKWWVLGYLSEDAGLPEFN